MRSPLVLTLSFKLVSFLHLTVVHNVGANNTVQCKWWW